MSYKVTVSGGESKWLSGIVLASQGKVLVSFIVLLFCIHYLLVVCGIHVDDVALSQSLIVSGKLLNNFQGIELIFKCASSKHRCYKITLMPSLESGSRVGKFERLLKVNKQTEYMKIVNRPSTGKTSRQLSRHPSPQMIRIARFCNLNTLSSEDSSGFPEHNAVLP
ncbi:hypothetical protein J6590_082307 [Homalodisca vitripennis]|nr:hypothetical protein J6590_082307 [Homalodisca vitripennis]